MVRYLPLGNGRLLVGFDSEHRLVDFYYSKFQAENHSGGKPFRFGISVNNVFKWVDSSVISLWDYLDHTMIGISKYNLSGIEFTNNDFVDIYDDILSREITAKNNSNERKEIHFFFHQNFLIYGNNIGDTAIYDPDMNGVIHYKVNRYFFAGTADQSGGTIDQYSIGVKDFEGLEGTWKDAEDSQLSMNPVATGSVDSVIRHTLSLEPGETKSMFYYILCASGLEKIQEMRKQIDYSSLKRMRVRTENYWKLWSSKEEVDVNGPINSLFKRSLFVIRSHVNDIGGIVASSDSEILGSKRDGYYYVWPRDAAIAAYSLVKANHLGPASKFFSFAKSVISPKGFFYHKYTPDARIASSWLPMVMGKKNILPIQEDETALVLWAMWNHFSMAKDIEYVGTFYESVIRKSANFILDYRDGNLPKPSFDLWEERFGVHTYTIATCYAALMAASNFSRTLGDENYAEDYLKAANSMRDDFDRLFYSDEKKYYARAFIDDKPDFTVDSAIMSTFLYGMKDPRDPKVVNSIDAITSRLWVKPIGGIARYENDYYQRIKPDREVPGNPWIITTLWLAQYYTAVGKTKEAFDLITWVNKQSQKSGILPEQVNPYDGSALSVSPLVWSHAEYVITILKLKIVPKVNN
ncbi:MAG: glycoside hydrolase family 15 protein [Candidatus Thermoplasmatota archaeon]|nr:glycoside hydrolase family 15 protein [Candidatus Thermoplasmatota archaeon]